MNRQAKFRVRSPAEIVNRRCSAHDINCIGQRHHEQYPSSHELDEESIQDEEEWDEYGDYIEPAGLGSSPGSEPDEEQTLGDMIINECIKNGVLDVLNTGIHIQRAQLSEGYNDEDYKVLISHPKVLGVSMFSSHSYVVALRDATPSLRQRLADQYAIGQTFAANITHSLASPTCNTPAPMPTNNLEDCVTLLPISASNLEQNYVLPAIPPFKTVSLNRLLGCWVPSPKKKPFNQLTEAYYILFTKGLTSPILDLQQYTTAKLHPKLTPIPDQVRSTLIEFGLSLAGYHIPESQADGSAPQTLESNSSSFFMNLGPDHRSRTVKLLQLRRAREKFLKSLDVALSAALERFRRLEPSTTNPARLVKRVGPRRSFSLKRE